MATISNGFVVVMAFLGIYGIFNNLFDLYRNESIIIDKKCLNLVINKFGSSQKIPFSNIKK